MSIRTGSALELLVQAALVFSGLTVPGCSLKISSLGPPPDVQCADLYDGKVNACANGIIARCSSGTVSYEGCGDKGICEQSWQVSGAWRCDERSPAECGQILCGRVCTDTSSDPANCGACGHACGVNVACVQGKCEATICEDGVKNADETDVDCGGPTCPKCGDSRTCSSSADCASGVCSGAPKTCQVPSCTDGVKNGSEADVDCGGGCSGCAVGKACLKGGDCASPFCNAATHKCVATECEDGVKNGAETDVDCGGTTCAKCGDCKKCVVGDDCASAACPSGVCLNVLQLAAGERHTCIRRSDNTIWCWGYNSSGDLGTGSGDEAVPAQVTAMGATGVEVAAGASHVCARKSDNTLWCWGDNWYGQLGDGTTSDQSAPVKTVAFGADVMGVAAGDDHTCARKNDNSLWCWGGSNHVPTQVASLSDVVGIAVGGNGVGGHHVCARKSDNTLWCWGDNDHGQIGDGTAVYKAVPTQVSDLGTTVIDVVAGESHTCARRIDDTLWCWGYNWFGQLGDGTTKSKLKPQQVTLAAPAISIGLGRQHTCAITSDHALWCWGWASDGQIGVGSGWGSLCNADSSLCVLSPMEVTALGKDLSGVAAGERHTCAHKADGTLWCWGSNNWHQVGDGSSDQIKYSPVRVGLSCQ